MTLIETLLTIFITTSIIGGFILAYIAGRYHESKLNERDWDELNDTLDQQLNNTPIFIESKPSTAMIAFTTSYSRATNDQAYRDEGITIDLPAPLIIPEEIAEQR